MKFLTFSIISLRLLALILCSNCSNTFNKVLMPTWHHTVKLLFANSVHHFSLLKMCHGWSKHFTSRYDPSTPYPPSQPPTPTPTQHPPQTQQPRATAWRGRREAGSCFRQERALEVAGTVRGRCECEFRLSVSRFIPYRGPRRSYDKVLYSFGKLRSRSLQWKQILADENRRGKRYGHKR